MTIAFFSDIHANLPALNAFFDDLEGIQPDMVYCLGDLVGYNVWANEVVNEIRKRAIPTIMGNHDEALLLPPKEGDRSNRGITRRIVTEENRSYLINLPRHLKLTFQFGAEKLNILLVHGSPKAINDYLVDDYPEAEISKMMENENADVILCGHTHIPYHRTIRTGTKHKHIINIGSVGKPKDGDPRLCYAILTFEGSFPLYKKELLKVAFRRKEYDLDIAMDAILKSDFLDSYADALKLAR